MSDQAFLQTAEIIHMVSLQSCFTNVLIVDDSPALQDRLVGLLSELTGVRVIGAAAEAEQAICAIQQCAPDIVILDLQLKTGTGIDVLEAVKNDHPDMLVIMLTNFAHDLFRTRCLAKGAHYFLDKSMDFSRIPALIQDYRQQHAAP